MQVFLSFLLEGGARFSACYALMLELQIRGVHCPRYLGNLMIRWDPDFITDIDLFLTQLFYDVVVSNKLCRDNFYKLFAN